MFSNIFNIDSVELYTYNGLCLQKQHIIIVIALVSFKQKQKQKIYHLSSLLSPKLSF